MKKLLNIAEVYVVGGYVRDVLLNRIPKDIDFVVVGTDSATMQSLGFEKVGADFDVFLHPITKDEFALARTERKTKQGYKGFETDTSPTITLKEDLSRRDLTINALAQQVIDWNEDTNTPIISNQIIDYFNGQQDLKDHVLRHVSEAFAEDPVRVLRVARFKARYNFNIVVKTMTLMKELVNLGELDHLTAERVWLETEKALQEPQPLAFFSVLNTCGALEILFPGLDNQSIVSQAEIINRCSLFSVPVLHTEVILFSNMLPEQTTKLLTLLKVPYRLKTMVKKYQLLLKLIHVDDNTLTSWEKMSAKKILTFFKNIDAFRNQKDLCEMVQIFLITTNPVMLTRVENVIKCYKAIVNVSFSSLTYKQQSTLMGKEIRTAIEELQLQKIEQVMYSYK